MRFVQQISPDTVLEWRTLLIFAYSFVGAGVAMVTADEPMAFSHSLRFPLVRLTLRFAGPIYALIDVTALPWQV